MTEVLAADGRPLKASLNRALRRQKLRALALIAPLLLFILVSFVMPIGDMLFRSVENQIVSETLPRTVTALEDWDANSDEAPGEAVFAALYTDMALATEYKTHTRLGSPTPTRRKCPHGCRTPTCAQACPKPPRPMMHGRR